MAQQVFPTKGNLIAQKKSLQLALLAVLWCLVLLTVFFLFWRFRTPAQCLVPPFDGLFPSAIVD